VKQEESAGKGFVGMYCEVEKVEVRKRQIEYNKSHNRMADRL
jgi:hypothetical protein